jgi:uncharacterized protein with HEPN domain
MNDKKKLRDIVDAIESIETYSVSSYEEFLADAKTQDAILYNLLIFEKQKSFSHVVARRAFAPTKQSPGFN